MLGGGWEADMEEWCLPLFLVFLSHILSEIFKCCGAKERSLGLGDTEFGPTFSSDLSPPAARPLGEKPQGQLLSVPIPQPSQAGRGWEGWTCFSQWEEALEFHLLYPCCPQDP